MPAAPVQTLYTPTGGSTLYTNSTVWAHWNSNFFTGTPAYATYTTATTGTIYLNDTVWMGWNGAYQETAEQRAAREAEHARVEAEYVQARARIEQAREGRREARTAANARAEELLLSLLTPEQAECYRDKGWFEVRGSRGGRWRIRNRGQSGNVDLMPEIGEEREATYCAHPPGNLPDADAYVAQMLQLVTDEEGFKKVANEHYRCPRRAA